MSSISETLSKSSYSTDIINENFPPLEIIEHELLKCIADVGSPLKEMCHYVMSAGGKRLRPQIIINCAQCFGPINNKVIAASVAAELIHLASLVHDDILDNSYLRHKRRTLNFEYGNHISVLVGDCLFAKAFNILNSNQLYTGLEYMVKAIQYMCDGEILQAANIESNSILLDDYFQRIKKKTAELISACCMIGASIHCSDKKQINSLGIFGLYLGCAYQIVDDILDFQGDSDKLGKPTFNDLLQGNITLPAILLLEHSEYRNYIEKIIKSKLITKELQDIIIYGLKETGALDRSYTIAAEFCQEARQQLVYIQESPYQQFLMSLTETLLKRCN